MGDVAVISIVVVHFKHNLVIDIFRIQENIILEWIPEELIIDDKSTLVPVMAGAIRQQAISWNSVDQSSQCDMMVTVS